MKTLRLFSPLFFLCFAVSTMWCQNKSSDKIRPKWMDKTPEAINHELQYVVVPVFSNDLSAANLKALNELIRYLPRDWKISATEELETISRSSKSGNEWSMDREDTYTLNVKAEGAPEEIVCQQIDMYWELTDGRGYHAYFLYQVASPGTNAVFEEVSTTAMYGVHGLWRSAILPGWGQFYKGSYVKGGLVLGGTVAIVGGIVATESIRKDYARKINQTHNLDQRQLYAKRMDQYALSRNICIGALGALYVYNLIDAIAAPGARRVVVKKGNNRGLAYNIYPTSPDGQSIAMAFNMTF